MRRCTSAPAVLNSCSRQTVSHAVAVADEGCGTVMIRARPAVLKAMRVNFKLAQGKLRIDILQENGEYVHNFTLCVLDLSHVAVAKYSNEQFVLAIVHQQRMHSEIFCTPLDCTVRGWIAAFTSKGVPAMHWFSTRPRCVLWPRSLMHHVCENASHEN